MMCPDTVIVGRIFGLKKSDKKKKKKKPDLKKPLG